MNPTYLVIFSLKGIEGDVRMRGKRAEEGEIVVTDKVAAASPLKVIEHLRSQYGSNLKSITGITGLKQAGNHKNVWISA